MTIRDSGQSFMFSEIKHLWDTDSSDPLILEAQKNALAMQMKWKHAVGFDLTGASGNADSFGLGVRLDSLYGNKMRAYDFYFSYLNSKRKISLSWMRQNSDWSMILVFLRNFHGMPRPIWKMTV